jgi:hypothetical protein
MRKSTFREERIIAALRSTRQGLQATAAAIKAAATSAVTPECGGSCGALSEESAG